MWSYQVITLSLALWLCCYVHWRVFVLNFIDYTALLSLSLLNNWYCNIICVLPDGWDTWCFLAWANNWSWRGAHNSFHELILILSIGRRFCLWFRSGLSHFSPLWTTFSWRIGRLWSLVVHCKCVLDVAKSLLGNGTWLASSWRRFSRGCSKYIFCICWGNRIRWLDSKWVLLLWVLSNMFFATISCLRCETVGRLLLRLSLHYAMCLLFS